MSKAKKSLYCVEITIVWLAIIESMIAVNITDNFTRYMVGEIVGTAMAICFIKNIYDSLDHALDLDQESAVKYYKKKSTIRAILVALVIAITLIISKYISVWAVFFGLANLKFAVYIQPLTDKYVLTKYHKKGR